MQNRTRPATDHSAPRTTRRVEPFAALTVREASTRAEREQIYALRYRIYVEQMGRTQFYADHERQRIEEPRDAHARLVGAWQGEELVGSVRTTYLRELDNDGEYAHYQISTARESTALASKLMVDPSIRNKGVGVEIGIVTVGIALRDGIEHMFIDTNPHLLGFYERLGLRVVREFHDAQYGDVVLMRLDLLDIDHLRGVGSPFAAVYDSHFPPA